MEDGASAEIAGSARGVVDLVSWRGAPRPAARLQSAATGASAPRDPAEFEHDGPVMHVLLRYTGADQQDAKTGLHASHVGPQLCRWLLLSWTGARHELVMTRADRHMLGVAPRRRHRGAVKLQKFGLIAIAWHITVVDGGLEHRCCECYSVVKREYDRLLTGETVT